MERGEGASGGMEMIHYHGTPLSGGLEVATTLARKHACVSFETKGILPTVAEVCQSFMLDNGAYSAWTRGAKVDVEAYAEWVNEWRYHPGSDWALIPDSIDGGEDENLRLIAQWQQLIGLGPSFVPVWHLHESLDVLNTFCTAYHRVALGSSGQYAEVGTDGWWRRMHEAMEVVCIDGRPRVKLHGLRMLNPTVFSHIPLSSADSTNVARNIAIDKSWTGSYQPVTKGMRALILMERIETHASAPRWNRPAYGTQMNMELIG